MKFFFILLGLWLCIVNIKQSHAQPTTFDGSFNQTGYVIKDLFGDNDNVSDIFLQSDGKILLCGYGRAGNYNKGIIIRYLNDGQIDSSFGNNGMVTISAGKKHTHFVKVQQLPNGKILAMGHESINQFNWDVVMVRLDNTGNIDSSFGTNGMFIKGFGDDLGDYGVDFNVMPDGHILGLVSFYETDAKIGIFKLASDGILDSSFNGSGFTQFFPSDSGVGSIYPESLYVNPLGEMIVGGFTFNNMGNHYLLVKFDKTGALDNTFHNTGYAIMSRKGGTETLRDMYVEHNGKIVFLGNETDQTQNITVGKINEDGTYDYSFQQTGFTQPCANCDVISKKMTLYGMDHIIIAGTYKFGDTNSTAALFIMDSLGMADTSWSMNGLYKSVIGVHYTASTASAVAAQPDGKILFAGTTTLHNKTDIFIARLNGLPLQVSNYNNELKDVELFPNPVTSDFITVKYTLRKNSTIQMCIYDDAGRNVMVTKDSKKAGVHTETINFSKRLIPGSYHFVLSDNASAVMKTFIIVNSR